MNFLDKLDKFMCDNNLNKRTLSQVSGIPYTTIDAFYKKGYENVKLATLKKLASHFNTTLDYLTRDEILDANWGKASDFNIEFHEMNHVKKYRSLDTYGKRAVDSILDIEHERIHYINNVSYTETTEYPTNIINYDTLRETAEYNYSPQLLGITAGGYPLLALQEHEPRSVKTNIKCDYALLIKGDSMEPDYPDKCILLIRKDFDFVDGDVCIAQIGVNEIVETTCKKVYLKDDTIELVPINRSHDTQTHLANEVKLIGKVVGVIN